MQRDDVRIDELIRDNRLRFRAIGNAPPSAATDAAYIATRLQLTGETACLGPYLHSAAVADYSEAMADGWGDFPPVLVYRLTAPFSWKETVFDRRDKYKDKPILKDREYPVGSLVLVGGFTRTESAEKAGLACVKAKIEEGTWAEAMKAAWAENTTHGWRRSKDETDMVLMSIHLTPEYAGLGERHISDLAGCSRATVNRWRKEQKRRHEEFLNGGVPLPPPPPASDPVEPVPEPTLTSGILLLKDAWGREVPEAVEDQFRCVPQAKKLTQKLREVATQLLILKYGDGLQDRVVNPGLDRVDVKDFEGHALQWADQADAALPFLVCPECEGKGVEEINTLTHKTVRCELCTGNGYLLRHQAETLPASYEREFRDAA